MSNIHTYVIDHGEDSPTVGGGIQTITGKVKQIVFYNALSKVEMISDQLHDLLHSDAVCEQLDGATWDEFSDLIQKL